VPPGRVREGLTDPRDPGWPGPTVHSERKAKIYNALGLRLVYHFDQSNVLGSRADLWLSVHCGSLTGGTVVLADARRRLVTDRGCRRPVLGEIKGFTWSTEESVAYEAAIEAINDAVGAYTALIAAEERKAAPDRAVIAAARSARAECARWREGLDPADRAAVAATRRRFAELAREVGRRIDA